MTLTVCYHSRYQGLIQLLRELDFGDPISFYLALKHMTTNLFLCAQVDQSGLYLLACSSLCFKKDNVSVYKEFVYELDLNCTAQLHKLKRQFKILPLKPNQIMR